MKKIPFFIAITFFFCLSPLFSQGEANNWFLSGSIGITFNTKDGEPSLRTDFFAADYYIGRFTRITISDKSGRLLFYYNRKSYYNTDHENIFTPQEAINRNIRFQVFPKPDDENVHYLSYLTSQNPADSNNGLAIYEMVLNDTTGLVELGQVNSIQLDFRCIGYEAIRHANGKDLWILFLVADDDLKTYSYQSILMTKDGLDFDTRKIFQSKLSSNYNYYNYYNYYYNYSSLIVSPDGRKVVSRAIFYDTSYSETDPRMYIYNFDRTNGILSNEIGITAPYYFNNGYGGWGGWGGWAGWGNTGQFSPCSNKFYIFSRDEDWDRDTSSYGLGLFQYSLEIHDSVAIKDSETRIWRFDNQKNYYPRSLQIAPNGKMYFPYKDQEERKYYLSAINMPDEDGQDCDLNIKDFFGLNYFSYRSIPYFFHEYLYKPFKGKHDVCIGDTIKIGACAANLYEAPDILWTGPNGFTSKNKVVVIPDATLDMTGWYVLNVKAEGVAEYTDSVFVTVHPLPEPEIITFDPLNICYGDRVTLKLDKEYESILWTTGETANRIHVKESGIVGVTVRDQYYCEAYTEVEIVVSDTLHPEIIGNNKICIGDSVELATNKFYDSYLWSTGDTTKSIKVFEPGLYKVIVTRKDCEGTSEEFKIEPLPLPNPMIDGVTTVCIDMESIYSIVPIPKGNTYWTLTEGGEITGENDNDSVIVQWMKVGTWELFVQQTNEFGCVGYDTLQVEVSPPFTFDIIPPDGLKLCPGGSLTLSAPEGYVKYLWSTDETTREIEITETGVYSVEVTDVNGCIGVDSVEVIRADSIEVSIIGDPKICPGGSIELEADKDYASYNWSNGDTTKQVTITQPGNYTLTATNEEGCSGEASVDVTLINAELKFANENPVDFGKILLGNNLIKTVQISNTSDYDIEYTATLKNNDGQITILQANNNIAANTTADITLKFTPDYPQYYNDTLIIETSSPCATSISKAITGAGFVTSKVWLPDVTATPGTKDYCIPLRAVITSKYIPDLNLAYLPVTINTDASLIVPTNPYTVSGRDLKIELNGSSLLLGSDTTTIDNICGWILFAGEDVTPLEITEFAWNNELVDVEIIDGSVTLERICSYDIRRVQGFTLTKMQISPNPANQSVRISIESGEVGTFDLSIYSTEGVEIKNYRWQRAKSSPELNEINIDLTAISSGIYRIMLRSPMEIFSQPLSVVK